MPPVTTSTVAPTARAPISKTRSPPVALRANRRGLCGPEGRTESCTGSVVTADFRNGPERCADGLPLPDELHVGWCASSVLGQRSNGTVVPDERPANGWPLLAERNRADDPDGPRRMVSPGGQGGWSRAPPPRDRATTPPDRPGGSGHGPRRHHGRRPRADAGRGAVRRRDHGRARGGLARAAPGRPPTRRLARRRVGLADPHPRGDHRGAEEPSVPPRRRPDRAGRDPDRVARDRVDAGGGRLGGPGPARPARHARRPRRGGAVGPRRRAPGRRRCRRRLRTARPARRPVRHRGGRAPDPRRGRRVADRHLRRTGLLRHRPHEPVAPRPGEPRPDPLRRPLLPAAGPPGRLRRPRHPPRPVGRRLAGGDQHVG